MPTSKEDQVFVIRFWLEDEAAEARSSRHWRARIVHVNDGQEFYADSIDDAFAIVRSLTPAEYQD